MTRNRRVGLAAACALIVAALVVPNTVDAQKVLNPGAFSLQSTGGQIRVGSLELDLTPQPLPQCSDGFDNDADTRVDDLDNQCAAGPNGEPRSSDDSELAPGYQPKINTSITGTIDRNGVVSIPASGVVFPPAYIGINFNGLWVVKAEVLATQTATGTIDPLTGAAVLNVAARVKLSGNVGNQLSSNCSIGTNNNPVRLNLITGRKDAIGTNGAITGTPYNPTLGTALLVDNAFSVPGASNCTAGIFDLNSIISGQVGLPSAAGRNVAVLAGKTTPTLARAITPVISSSAPLGGNEAPFAVGLSGASSTVATGPASYSWSFSDGTTATGEYVDKTFGAGTQSVTLTVTDGDGDSASTTQVFVVNPGTGTTTTTTTTTTSTTTSTTTTVPPTTSTTTTTTVPPTTSTTTTTTVPPTTSTTTTTTVPPTTSTTTTTTVPPTTSTTTTTVPAPSDDQVSVRFSGALNYAVQGRGAGDLIVRRDSFGISSISGFLDVPGANGGTARVSVSATRAWILPLWTGQVTVRDQGAGVNVSTPIFGSISRAGTPTSAQGTASWFTPGAFPNLFRPYSLSWSVTDAG